MKKPYLTRLRIPRTFRTASIEQKVIKHLLRITCQLNQIGR